MPRRDDIERLLINYNRRLQALKERKALYGLDTPVAILTEIEDVEIEIESLQTELKQIENKRKFKKIQSLKQPTINLTGIWELQEEYEFGHTRAKVHLDHTGKIIIGKMTIHDKMDDGKEWIIEESISGTVQGIDVTFSGNRVRIVKGDSDDYEPDRWSGVIVDDNTIKGHSEDKDGTTGTFLMKRVGVSP